MVIFNLHTCMCFLILTRCVFCRKSWSVCVKDLRLIVMDHTILLGCQRTFTGSRIGICHIPPCQAVLEPAVGDGSLLFHVWGAAVQVCCSNSLPLVLTVRQWLESLCDVSGLEAVVNTREQLLWGRLGVMWYFLQPPSVLVTAGTAKHYCEC